MINPDYKPVYPPSTMQQLRACIEMAEKLTHRIQDEMTFDTEAEQDAHKLCGEMLEVLTDLFSDYIQQLEEALALCDEKIRERVR
jgi:hypothetical protein